MKIIFHITVLSLCLIMEFAQAQSSSTAISLRALANQLKICTPNDSCTEQLLHFQGMTTIHGYILDTTTDDVIFYGEMNPDIQPLSVENFVVALRNAWLMYAEQKERTTYYSYPGCSIDPDPQVFQKLNQLTSEFQQESNPEARQKYLQQFEQICLSPQTVRVMGVPFHSQFAQVMVQADYDLKSIVDGSDTLDVEGLFSVGEIKMNYVEQSIQSGEPVALPAASINRFWLHPGTIAYQQAEGIVEIASCTVKLLTEREYKVLEDQVAHGEVDPFARKFADFFTDHYDAIGVEKPVFQRLHSLYSLVALAKSLRSHIRSSSELDYFLKDYQIKKVNVPQIRQEYLKYAAWTMSGISPVVFKPFSLTFPAVGRVNTN